MDKPDIVEIIGARIDLRPAGRELRGLCPLHPDRRPSLRVNTEKQLWFCDPCGEGGDVIRFVELTESLDFKSAIKSLGINGSRPPSKRSQKDRIAEVIARWCNEKFLLVAVRCRELSQQIAIAEYLEDARLAESLLWEWEILANLHDDLSDPACAAELWKSRAWVESITGDVALDPPEPFPKLTSEYLGHLEYVSCLSQRMF